MTGFDPTNATPLECLDMLDGVIANLREQDDPGSLLDIQEQLRSAAERSGRVALHEVADRGDRTEMLDNLRQIIASNIVRKVAHVPKTYARVFSTLDY